MSGQALYERYAQFCDKMNNCEVDTWENLTADEQNVWNALAESLQGPTRA